MSPSVRASRDKGSTGRQRIFPPRWLSRRRGRKNGLSTEPEGASRLSLNLATGWDVLLYAVKNYQYNGDVNLAAAIAFYAILSSIPLLILTTTAAGMVFGSNPTIQDDLIRAIQGFHPYFSGELLRQIGRIEEKSRLLGWVGVVMLVWSSSLIFNALQTALNIIFRSSKSRNYFVSKLLAIGMIPLGWLIALLNVGITSLAAVTAQVPLPGTGGRIFHALFQSILFRYLLPYLVVVAFVAFLYKAIPTTGVSFKNALGGSALFSALMEITKHLFTWYISNRDTYNIIYGSLETVVLLVIWVFYVSVILLFCAELVSAYQKRDLILLEKAFLRAKEGRP